MTRRDDGIVVAMSFTYILRLADGTLYVGYTDDLRSRLTAHEAGTASSYTLSVGQ